jgi:hypothetical protein
VSVVKSTIFEHQLFVKMEMMPMPVNTSKATSMEKEKQEASFKKGPVNCISTSSLFSTRKDKRSKVTLLTLVLLSFLLGVCASVSFMVVHSFIASEPITSVEPKTIIKTTSLTNDYTAASASWCPKAVCLNSDLCRPCQRRFLILLATGRSGSTTLNFMLDSLPSVRMSGENNDELRAIRYMMENVMLKPSVHYFDSKVERKTAWGHNPIPPGAAACVGQKMMETINPPLMSTDQSDRPTSTSVMEDDADTIIGFKTIRFLHYNDTTEDHADTLPIGSNRAFPVVQVYSEHSFGI